MRRASHLLRRHLRRCHLETNPIDSRSIALQNPKSICSPNPFNPLSHACVDLHFSATISFRSFSWHSWTDGSKSEGGDGSLGSEWSGEELSLVDGRAELDLGVDEVLMVEGNMDQGIWSRPVHVVVSLLDGFHEFTGIPWWVVIPTSTLGLRVFLLPVLLLQLKKMGEIARLYPKLPSPFPLPLSGRSFSDQFSLFQKKRLELGCPSFLWSFAYFFVQFPCFLLWMYSIRRMCLDNHPGFDSGGILWFQDLTGYSHGILGPVFPFLIAGLHYVNVQVSFQTLKVEKLHGALRLLAKYYKLYLDVLSIPLIFIGFCVPQGSLLYWATNSSLTLVQQLSLRHPYVRMKLGLPDEKALLTPKSSVGNKGPLELKICAENVPAEKLLDLALEKLAKGHQDTALPLLRIATEKNSELARAHVALGQILCSRGLFVEASGYFEQAITKIKMDDVGLLSLAFFGAGVSNIWQGNKTQGIEYLKRIAQLKEPDSPMEKACYYQGLVLLGSTLFQQGEKSEAAKYLRIAATYDPAVNAYIKECEEGGQDLQKSDSIDPSPHKTD